MHRWFYPYPSISVSYESITITDTSSTITASYAYPLLIFVARRLVLLFFIVALSLFITPHLSCLPCAPIPFYCHAPFLHSSYCLVVCKQLHYIHPFPCYNHHNFILPSLF